MAEAAHWHTDEVVLKTKNDIWLVLVLTLENVFQNSIVIGSNTPINAYFIRNPKDEIVPNSL